MCRHEEKITMSTKVTMPFVAAIVALASPALGVGASNRDNEYASKSVQYCIPQFDELPATTRVYC
jgi:hypothetical protein